MPAVVAPRRSAGGVLPPPPLDEGGGGGGGDGGGGNPGWVTLASFLHPTQAHIARLRLESHGVPCVLLGELTAATHVLAIASGGVKLQVPRLQLARAARLLRKQPAMGRPEPRVALADFEQIMHAKSAAAVIESSGLWCEVIERRTAGVPRWGRLLPGSWRRRFWPAASVVVERKDLVPAARALSGTPFIGGLTQAGRSAEGSQCAVCAAEGDWAVWQLRWPLAGELAGPGVSGGRIPRLVRRCGRCGGDWR